MQELVIATNPTVEGEATAHYLAQLARRQGVKPTRLAHTVHPVIPVARPDQRHAIVAGHADRLIQSPRAMLEQGFGRL